MTVLYPWNQPTPTAIPTNFPRASDPGSVGPYYGPSTGSSFVVTQRHCDLQMKKQLEMSIEETAKTKSRLEHMLIEVNERLGLNKPDGDHAA